MIVREKLETEAGSPEVLTVMIKRKKGFNPEANDWEFLLISGDTTKIKKREKTGDCESCHGRVSAKDFVFESYVPATSSRHQNGAPELFELLLKQPDHLALFR